MEIRVNIHSSCDLILQLFCLFNFFLYDLWLFLFLQLLFLVGKSFVFSLHGRTLPACLAVEPLLDLFSGFVFELELFSEFHLIFLIEKDIFEVDLLKSVENLIIL